MLFQLEHDLFSPRLIAPASAPHNISKITKKQHAIQKDMRAVKELDHPLAFK